MKQSERVYDMRKTILPDFVPPDIDRGLLLLVICLELVHYNTLHHHNPA